MSYVHLHFFVLQGADFPITDIILVDTLGRSSVPLLSVLSGYFMVGFFSKRPYGVALLARGRSLIVPMVIWNLVACVLFGFTYPLWDALLAATDQSRMVHLTFLRDVFVLSLLMPIFLVSAQKVPVIFICAIFVYYLLGWSNVVILRPQIAFFFGLGILFALYPQPMPKFSKIIALVGVFIAIYSQVFHRDALGPYFDNLYLRPVMAGSFWVLSLWIAASYPNFGRFEKTAFAFFLMHVIIFNVVGTIYANLPALHSIPVYYALWILTPLLSYAAVYLLWPLTGKFGRMATA